MLDKLARITKSGLPSTLTDSAVWTGSGRLRRPTELVWSKAAISDGIAHCSGMRWIPGRMAD